MSIIEILLAYFLIATAHFLLSIITISREYPEDPPNQIIKFSAGVSLLFPAFWILVISTEIVKRLQK